MGDKEIDKLHKELAPLTQAQRQRNFQQHTFGFLITVIVCVGIWGFTTGAYFWPGWVILVGGIDVAYRAYATFADPPDEPDELDELDEPDELEP